MSEVLTVLVNKLPAGFLMVFMPLLCISGVWVFSHVRTDRQGKRYWYSQKYEDTKRNRKQDVILKELHETKLDLMNLQILSTELAPNTKLSIYDEYKKLGGNSYIDEYVKRRVAVSVDGHTEFIRDSNG